MRKYYRALDKNEKLNVATDVAFALGGYARYIEVDDMPEVKKLNLRWSVLAGRFANQLADPWHKASDPPKPEDFQPTGKIDVLWDDGEVSQENPAEWGYAFNYTTRGKPTHWRKITPPKP